jgi:hypothetical protein
MLTGVSWRYRKIPQKGFEILQARRFADLKALEPLEQGRLSGQSAKSKPRVGV